MLDYGKRVLIVLVIATFIGLLFMGASNSKAHGLSSNELVQHWVWPAEGKITDHFGTRDGKHKGIDIAGSSNSNIYVVSDGVVSKSYYSDSYGHVVFVEHQMEGFETVYAHLSSRNVAEGESVKKGQVIGRMGNTGRSSGVHLHFEVHRQNWTVDKQNAINPLFVFNEMKQEAKFVEATADPHDHEELSESEKDEAYQVERNHIVQEGETLWEIGEYYDVSIETLLDLNQISDPNLIFVGQIIVIKKEVAVERYINFSRYLVFML